MKLLFSPTRYIKTNKKWLSTSPIYCSKSLLHLAFPSWPEDNNLTSPMQSTQTPFSREFINLKQAFDPKNCYSTSREASFTRSTSNRNTHFVEFLQFLLLAPWSNLHYGQTCTKQQLSNRVTVRCDCRFNVHNELNWIARSKGSEQKTITWGHIMFADMKVSPTAHNSTILQSSTQTHIPWPHKKQAETGYWNPSH